MGWSIGWWALRVLPLERYPVDRFGVVDVAGTHTAFVVEVVGLVVLEAGVWGLAGLCREEKRRLFRVV